MDLKVLTNVNKKIAKKIFLHAINIGINFKLRSRVKHFADNIFLQNLFSFPLPEEGNTFASIAKFIRKNILPYSTNFSSKKFLGFPDAGNSISGIYGSILSIFLNQNLINQPFCSPVATFVEIQVISWFRSFLGYEIKSEINNVYDIGGVVTSGGTISNSIAILLAREKFYSSTFKDGLFNKEKSYLVVPKGIGHYSVKSAQMWDIELVLSFRAKMPA